MLSHPISLAILRSPVIKNISADLSNYRYTKVSPASPKEKWHRKEHIIIIIIIIMISHKSVMLSPVTIVLNGML